MSSAKASRASARKSNERPRGQALMRIGLGGKYLIGITLGFVLLGTLVYGGFRLQRNAYSELSKTLATQMQLQGEASLERRGEAVATLLADALTNPVYFVDLERIGEIT